MTDQISTGVYRVDKFTVPADVKEEFIGKVKLTHDLLRTLPGFQQDFVLEQATENGDLKIITLVAWENADAMANARTAVGIMQKDIQFNPQDFIQKSGITMERGDYQRIDGV